MLASANLCPVLPVLLVLSNPARSTKASWLMVTREESGRISSPMGSRGQATTRMLKMEWERED